MAAKATPEVNTHKVLSTVKHGAKTFRKGSTIELTEKEAAPLLKYKAIEPAK